MILCDDPSRQTDKSYMKQQVGDLERGQCMDIRFDDFVKHAW